MNMVLSSVNKKNVGWWDAHPIKVVPSILPERTTRRCQNTRRPQSWLPGWWVTFAPTYMPQGDTRHSRQTGLKICGSVKTAAPLTALRQLY